MIRSKYIGATMTILKFGVTIVIEDDSTKYDYYRKLGLSYIFESEPKKMTFPKVEKETKVIYSDLPKLSTLHNKPKSALLELAEKLGLECGDYQTKAQIIEEINDYYLSIDK